MTTQAAREQHCHEPGRRLPDSPYGTAQAPAGSIPTPLAGLVGNQAMTNHLSARHPASPLPDGFRQQAEPAFGRNLSHVRLREDPGVSDLGAIAATYDSDIHLAPSAPEPSTPEEWAYKAIELMQEMMAHLKDKNLRKLVKHRINTPSPTLPPKTPNPKKPKP